MDRRNFLKFSLGSAVLGSMGGFASKDIFGGTAKKPNIIFVFCDDLGWGDLGCFGNKKVKTPNIDRLAKEGLRLTQFYVGAPVCSPSRAAYMAGRFVAETGIHYAIGSPENNAKNNSAEWLNPDYFTVTDLMKEAGYVTGHVGKWHMGHRGLEKDAPPPKEYGIDYSVTTHSTGKNLKGLTNANKADVITDEALKFIREHKDEPFYLNLWHMDPHGVLEPTDEMMEPYKHLMPNIKNHSGIMAVFYAIVTNIDKNVGRLMDELKKQGIYDNTLIIFSSDNGPSPAWGPGTSHSGAGLAGPFRGCKASIYEGGIRMPFIAWCPGRVPAGVIDRKSVVTSMDLMPTFAKMLNVSVLESISSQWDGEDRSDVLLGKPSKRTKPIFWEYRGGAWGRLIQSSPRLAMRDGDWKLLMNPDGTRVELYNLEKQPNETANVAEYETARAEKMKKQLLNWAKSLPDPDKSFGAEHNNVWTLP
ncbi:MAG: sulfatase-like hydrolase/transferase [Phycisphaerae bacterium]|nr:sulfatase-like hydrolase/transferase [Phycisphaerae bacterium]